MGRTGAEGGSGTGGVHRTAAVSSVSARATRNDRRTAGTVSSRAAVLSCGLAEIGGAPDGGYCRVTARGRAYSKIRAPTRMPPVENQDGGRKERRRSIIRTS